MMNETEYAELRTLVDHAKDELHRAGLFDKDSDYAGMMGKSVLAIMKVFSKQGHSGFSAMQCRALFDKLSNFETLTPITSDPKEWTDISEGGGVSLWQNNRNPAMFSEDGGKTWYDVNDKEKASDLKERNAELAKIPFEDYVTAGLMNDTLGNDFKIATAWFATLKAGKDTDKTEGDIRGYMKKIVEEIVLRDKVTFKTSTMKDTSIAILADTLWELFGKGGKGILAVPPYAQMIADGRKTLKLAQKQFNLEGFNGLIHGDNVIGMIRFEDGEEINEASFEKRKEEHMVTRDELKSWGWEFPLFGWKVREFVLLEKPVSVKVPKDTPQPILKDAHLQATGSKLTNERARLRPANPENETERCGFCVFFQKPDGCKIVDGPVTSDLVCDWIQSRGLEEEAPTYEVADEDWIPFGVGMIVEQPYSHVVRDVAITPAGPMVLIEDTAGIPHRFSLGKEFHIGHTSFEHHWTQEEVDGLIVKGKEKLSSEVEMHEIKKSYLK